MCYRRHDYMSMTFEQEHEERNAEIKRFYLQQKSLKPECEYGNKNCALCQQKDCKIRQFVEI